MECYVKDYPRPQFVRNNWENLNGAWDFAFDDAHCGEQESWYKDFNIKEVEVHYSVSRQTEGRKRNKELIITNY